MPCLDLAMCWPEPIVWRLTSGSDSTSSTLNAPAWRVTEQARRLPGVGIYQVGASDINCTYYHVREIKWHLQLDHNLGQSKSEC
jgi:hypothetical protein